jgi:hypothetical protein
VAKWEFAGESEILFDGKSVEKVFVDKRRLEREILKRKKGKIMDDFCALPSRVDMSGNLPENARDSHIYYRV